MPYQTFATADGHLMLAVGNDNQFAALAQAIGELSWSDDPRFATNPARVQHRDALIPALSSHFRTRTTSEWIERLRAAGVPCGPVNDIPTALDSPQAQHRQVVQHVTDGYGDNIPQIAPVPKLDRSPPRIHRPPPLLGEHTDEVLREKLGLTPEKIDSLRESGVI